MKLNPNVISVGDDYRSWPKRLWGTEDHKRDAEFRSQLKQMGEVPVPQPRNYAVTFPLHDDPQGDARRRRLETDRLLEKHNLRPRRWV